MSLVKYGGGIVQMSGKIAGNVFARNRYGNYVRSWTKPVNGQSEFQTIVRGILSYLSERWSSVLTPAQRLSWDNYAESVSMLNRLGESIKLSGMNHYIRSNSSLLQAGLTEVTDGPTVLELPETDPTIECSISEADQEISVAFDVLLPWVKESGAGMIISMGIPISPSRVFFGGPYRYADTILGVDSTGAESPAVVACPFVATETQKVVVRAKIVRLDGRVSNYFRNELLVEA